MSGLSGLWTSIGQLIPFIIGVGGLGLVITRWVVWMWVKRVIARSEKSGWEVDMEEDEKLNEDAEEYVVDGLERAGLRQGYERWKKAHAAEQAGRNG